MAALVAKKLKLPSSSETRKVAAYNEKRWKILIVDDEEEIHAVTKLALKGYEFGGHSLEFLHAHSGAQAQKILAENHDIALVLLDVVMESESAGLEVVGYLRTTLNNKLTRIVLRTGQPGQAPEKKVIMDYDINDYKEKTELTSTKLYTLMSASLRAYRDMVALEDSRKGLRKIITATADIFSLNSMQTLAEGALDQLLSLLRVKEGSSFYGRKMDALAALRMGSEFEVLAGTGRYSMYARNADVIPPAPFEIEKLISEAAKQGQIVKGNQIVCYHKGRAGHENILYVSGDISFDHLDHDLIELYARNVSVIFENFDLNQQIDEAQREVVYRLGEAVETRSTETGNHLKRVAEISKLLALEYGLSENEAEIIKYASPLHDVGKIGVPDAILNKPGKLDADEWKTMQSHTELGHDMLAGSDKPILKAGALIAREHHEKWDGSGYPEGKAGENIHIYGRITALADVYDALANKRCYKDAWPPTEVYSYIQEQRGKHFQPELVDIMMQNIESIEEIMIDHDDKTASNVQN